MSNNMAGKGKLFVIAIFFAVTCSHARIHRLRIEEDVRQQIDLSTFGFLRGGYMVINITGFHVEDIGETDQLFGFTLEKTVSTGIAPYIDNKQNECILLKQDLPKDSSISIIFFSMDLKNMRVNISRQGEDLKYMNISLLTEEEFSNRTRQHRSSGFSDQNLIGARHRRRREAEPPTMPRLYEIETNTADTKAPQKQTTGAEMSPKQTTASANTPKQTTGAETSAIPKQTSGAEASAEETTKLTATGATRSAAPVLATNNSLVPENGSIQIFKDNKELYSFYLLLTINTRLEEGLYNLFFYNCHNYNSRGPKIKVNFTAEIVEKNKDNYLSAGEMPLPLLFLVFCLVYLGAALLWLYVLRRSQEGSVFKIHYLMLVLTFVKSIASLFHAINTYFIQKEGHHEEAFAILYYITHLMKGALLIVTIVLIGAGWAFVKHILSERDKKIFIFVIPLQVLANVAQIIIEETEEGQLQYTTWREIFILVDLLCCGAILFPVVWSIRHLQEASQTDGKAAINLQKLKIFRHFYILIVCYIYFTRIIVYLLSITVPFQYAWLDELSRETATLLFFVITGYKFRPAPNNPYLQLATDSDDEVEMDQVVTQVGAYETLTKVNVKSHNKDGTTQLAHREASLEYD